jgi:hypothetical protein
MCLVPELSTSEEAPAVLSMGPALSRLYCVRHLRVHAATASLVIIRQRPANEWSGLYYTVYQIYRSRPVYNFIAMRPTVFMISTSCSLTRQFASFACCKHGALYDKEPGARNVGDRRGSCWSHWFASVLRVKLPSPWRVGMLSR